VGLKTVKVVEGREEKQLNFPEMKKYLEQTKIHKD